jgi:hypothetical protein
MADHEDYLSGEAPMAHHESHESLGSDEISVAGLLGVTAELAAHALIATAHQDAPGLIAAHALIAAAHHARYTDVEATIIANAQIAIHAAIPTAHQNAPALIATHKADASAHHAKYTDAEARAAINNIFGSDGKADVNIDLDTHKLINVVDPTVNQDAVTLLYLNTVGAAHAGDPSAHHAKYTDAEARALMSPISIPPAAFVPRFDTHDWQIQDTFLGLRTSTTLLRFYAPVIFPNSVTVTRLTLYGYRTHAAAELKLYLYRSDGAAALALLADVSATWTTGYSSVFDATIDNAVINNLLYSYDLYLRVDPGAAVGDVKFTRAMITFTG